MEVGKREMMEIGVNFEKQRVKDQRVDYLYS